MAETILVVDDSVTVRTAVRWVAESKGYEVQEAVSIGEARAALEAATPDALLVDYHLPDGTGVAFCRELRDDPRFGTLRILIVFGETHPFDPEDAKAARASGVLRKPFRSNTLFELLEQEDAIPPAPVDPPAQETAPQNDDKTGDDVEVIEDLDVIEEAADEDTAETVETAPPVPAPPGAPKSSRRRRTRSRSGAFRTVPMPGSGLHRIPPPGGQSVKVAGKGTRPRSPSGAFRPIHEDVPDNATQEAAPQDSASPATAPQPVAPETAHDENTPVPASQPQRAPAAVAEPTASPRNEPTTEINVLEDKDIDHQHTDTPPQAQTKPDAGDAAVYTVTEAQLRELVEARTQAIVEEQLPAIARKALAQLLRTQLKEQIVKQGVAKRVQQFLDKDLPAYAQRAVDQRLDAENDQ